MGQMGKMGVSKRAVYMFYSHVITRCHKLGHKVVWALMFDFKGQVLLFKQKTKKKVRVNKKFTNPRHPPNSPRLNRYEPKL